MVVYGENSKWTSWYSAEDGTRRSEIVGRAVAGCATTESSLHCAALLKIACTCVTCTVIRDACLKKYHEAELKYIFHHKNIAYLN